MSESIDLTDCIFIDNHAHSLLRDPINVDKITFRGAFTESTSMTVIEKQVASSVNYQCMLARLSEILGADSENEILDRRQNFTAGDYANNLWDRVSFGAFLIDDGFLADKFLSVADFMDLSGRPAYRVARLESIMEAEFADCTDLEDLERRIENQIRSPENRQRPVALKSIAAYRGGLRIELIDRRSAIDEFGSLKDQRKAFRASGSPLHHYLLHHSLEIAAENALPVQIHCGFGDTDLYLPDSDPSHLTPLLKFFGSDRLEIVLLHCFPYVREAGYMCSVFPNVYMDLSLGAFLLSPMLEQLYHEALSIVPYTKLLAGTDGHSIPETHWFGALSTREAIGGALGELVLQRRSSVDQAYEIGEAILFRNARSLYRLEGLV